MSQIQKKNELSVPLDSDLEKLSFPLFGDLIVKVTPMMWMKEMGFKTARIVHCNRGPTTNKREEQTATDHHWQKRNARQRCLNEVSFCFIGQRKFRKYQEIQYDRRSCPDPWHP